MALTSHNICLKKTTDKDDIFSYKISVHFHIHNNISILLKYKDTYLILNCLKLILSMFPCFICKNVFYILIWNHCSGFHKSPAIFFVHSNPLLKTVDEKSIPAWPLLSVNSETVDPLALRNQQRSLLMDTIETWL